jgi:GT2 family glycosyltransferase
MPTISIIIPSHNRAKILPRAVESAWKAGQDLEVIVVDDASSDSTPEVCRSLKTTRCIRLAKNSGLAVARNTGILASAAPFLCFLDDDDILVENGLEELRRALEADRDAAFAYGRYYWGDPESCSPRGEPLPLARPSGDIFWRLLEVNYMPVHTLLVRKDCLAHTGLFSTHFPGVEDWHLWLRLAAAYPVQTVPEIVAVYRAGTRTTQQMTSDQRRMCEVARNVQEAALRLPRALKGSHAQRQRVRAVLHNRLSDLLILDARAAAAAGEWRSALRNALRGFVMRPGRAARPGAFLLVARSALACSLGRGNRENRHSTARTA